MVAERRNAAKVLLFLDVGGSMDDHVRASEELFSAARAEFKHLAFFYFHNCPYEALWTENRRRRETAVPTEQVIRTYGPGYRAVFVGDASMSPYEIVQPGGGVEHWNEEPGSAWLGRLLRQWPRAGLAEPGCRGRRGGTRSPSGLVQQLMEGRMYQLTLAGLDEMAPGLR